MLNPLKGGYAMSQRGSRPKWTPQNTPTHWWGSIRNVIAISLILILSTSLTLIAQNYEPFAHPISVTICVDGTERQVTTVKPIVQTLLHQENISLGEHDVCEPPISERLADGMVVSITRKTFEMKKERVEIAPPVQTRWDRRMTTEPVVIRAGKPGIAEQTRCVWKKDGVVSVEWVQGKRVIKRPTPTIVVRGSQPSRAGTTGRKVMKMVATAYDPGPLSCGPNATGRTAIGMRATKGIIAVDPRVIPLGSRVYVDGYGPAIAADTGGAIKGNKIDVCFDTRREALNWGRRTVTVVILQ